MKYKLVGLIIIACILFTGCKEPTNEEVYYEVQKNFTNLNSYECIAEVKMLKDNQDIKYKTRHKFKAPNKYLVEVLAPTESEGFITIYNGTKAWFYHPQINQSMELKNFNNSREENMFIAYFLKVSLTGEYVKIDSEEINSEEYLTVEVEIPGNNIYRNTERLWIHKESLLPYKLVIFDKDNNPTIEVLYSDFQYNKEIKDAEFKINRKSLTRLPINFSFL